MTAATPTPPHVAAPLDDLAAVITAYVDAMRHAEQWSAARDGLRRAIEARLGDAEVGTVDGRPRVRRTHYVERRLDAGLVRQHASAELLDACTVVRPRTRFSLIEGNDG